MSRSARIDQSRTPSSSSSRAANKQQIKAAVEEIFDVDVIGVRIINVKPKHGRYGRRIVVRKPGWKKAIVTIAEGQRLDIFEGV